MAKRKKPSDDTFDFDGTGLLPADLDITTVGGDDQPGAGLAEAGQVMKAAAVASGRFQ